MFCSNGYFIYSHKLSEKVSEIKLCTKNGFLRTGTEFSGVCAHSECRFAHVMVFLNIQSL